MYVIIYIVGLLCAFSSLAEANSLRVAPILLDVSAPGATTTLNLRNEGAEKLHVQIRVFRWTGTHTNRHSNRQATSLLARQLPH